jgi:hypothetical protein
LVKIIKNYGRGIFRIAVQHLGDVRPFTHTNSKFQKLSNQSKNQLYIMRCLQPLNCRDLTVF